MWVKVSISALVIALIGGAMYYNNDVALDKERRECTTRYKNLAGEYDDDYKVAGGGIRGEYVRERIKYEDYLAKNAGLRKDIAALTKQKDELVVSNAELTSSNEAKDAELKTQQSALAELQVKCKDAETIQAIVDRIKGLEEENREMEVTKQAEQTKHDQIVAETEQLMVNNAALRQLKADQDAHLSPPNLKTTVRRVIDEFALVVINGGASDVGIVPGSKLAVMRDGNKIAELDVNAVEAKTSTATILLNTVAAGEVVEVGDVVVSVRP
ncbi:MAG: hypothetical protein Q4C05_04880 [Akkermansia sp.]|nr:hypothetical protein [Akkermansia sp.]